MRTLLLSLTFLITPVAFSAESSENPIPAITESAPNELKVEVKGMVCAFCAQGIEKSFMAESEVASIEVSLANKYIKIKFKDGQKLSKEKIAELLKDSGYEAVFGG